MPTVTVHTTSIFLVFNSSTSTGDVSETLFLDIPQKRKSKRVMSGERAGYGIGPSLPIHRSENFTS